jgi:hypothetical protein
MAPPAQATLSCYGEGGQQEPGVPAHGAGAGPLVLDGLQRGSRGRAIRADAVVQPGGDVTLSVGPARFPGASSCAGAAA